MIVRVANLVCAIGLRPHYACYYYYSGDRARPCAGLTVFMVYRFIHDTQRQLWIYIYINIYTYSYKMLFAYTLRTSTAVLPRGAKNLFPGLNQNKSRRATIGHGWWRLMYSAPPSGAGCCNRRAHQWGSSNQLWRWPPSHTHTWRGGEGAGRLKRAALIYRRPGLRSSAQ